MVDEVFRQLTICSKSICSKSLVNTFFVVVVSVNAFADFCRLPRCSIKQIRFNRCRVGVCVCVTARSCPLYLSISFVAPHVLFNFYCHNINVKKDAISPLCAPSERISCTEFACTHFLVFSGKILMQCVFVGWQFTFGSAHMTY